ncbi:MAG: triacylglycerol lipase [Aquabacterium sp.]
MPLHKLFTGPRSFTRHQLSAVAMAWGVALATGHPAAQAAGTEAKTQYPIVLVHGMSGFDAILGIDYFYRIPAELRRNGATVYVASISAFNDNDVRGEQLLKQLKQWAAAKGHTRFNLIAHSQGGPTARYVHGVAPQLVASITSIGSPHTMTSGQADNELGKLLTNYAKEVAAFGKLLGWMSGSSGLPQDPAALQAWAENTDKFNARFPAGKPIVDCGEGAERVGNTYFYSATGNQPATNSKDISDGILAKASAGMPAGMANDGLVPVCATHWGKVLRDDFPWNHLDETNQVLGAIGKDAPDPVAFYVQQATRLKALGL